jgi:5-formyltetrahydrofolate cyclo-ligase
MSVKLKKSELRSRLRALLSRIKPSQFERAGMLAASHIEQWLLSFEKKLCVAYFTSLPDEISTKSLEELLIRLKITLVTPLIENNNLYFFVVDKESRKNIKIELNKIDIIFMPGLGFDKLGHRLGRGKGHFDKALGQKIDRPILVGLSMDEQVVAEIPFEPHDVQVNFLCTPMGIRAVKQRE